MSSLLGQQVKYFFSDSQCTRTQSVLLKLYVLYSLNIQLSWFFSSSRITLSAFHARSSTKTLTTTKQAGIVLNEHWTGITGLSLSVTKFYSHF